ncbi:hypothetical protein FPOAC1_008802 [Fusarium poae]|uniref:hypothetical protein n=1 Tax=Fusarium poae TaxID=36050 RepID=UPI001CE9E181|nr:hypothetical protein FPOAC1_008802 [Fusarium poae]KAG8669407.1 hypothetical protein FPOAC1_008802 [Fusarium poae]
MLLWLAGLGFVTASITIPLSPVAPLPLSHQGAATSADDLFRRSCPEEVASSNPYTPSLFASSFSNDVFSTGLVFPSSGGLIRGAVEAWAQHQHLVLRPEEVWFEVLVQMNLYMSVHSEKVRGLFVEHEGGKEKIVVEGNSWDDMVVSFGDEIDKRVKTEWLKDWIMPGFSTSTPKDDVTAAALMMGLMKQFFDFEGWVVCGIPSVTLLGTREDWVKLEAKLDYLKEFGPDPELFAEMLRPIMKRFVSSWDDAHAEETKLFWEQIVRVKKQWSCGEGANEWDVSGWITGFDFFDRNGWRRGYDAWEDYDEDEDEDEDENEEEEKEKVKEPVKEEPQMGIFASDWTVTMDGQKYLHLSLSDVSTSYAKAPVKMKNFPHPGVDTEAYILAGNIGVERTEEGGKVTAQPVSGWFAYGPVNSNHTVGPFIGNWNELESIAVGIEDCKTTKKEKEEEEEVKDL